jgi:hypothetical protein
MTADEADQRRLGHLAEHAEPTSAAAAVVVPATPRATAGAVVVKNSSPRSCSLEYLWCRPPTRGKAMMRPAFGGSTLRVTGASPSSAMCGLSSL